MNDKIKVAVMHYERILDELEFVQRIMELYDIPETVATKVTENIGGLLEQYKIDMLDIAEKCGDGYAVAEYFDTQDEIRADKVGGITRVNK